MADQYLEGLRRKLSENDSPLEEKSQRNDHQMPARGEMLDYDRIQDNQIQYRKQEYIPKDKYEEDYDHFDEDHEKSNKFEGFDLGGYNRRQNKPKFNQNYSNNRNYNQKDQDRPPRQYNQYNNQPNNRRSYQNSYQTNRRENNEQQDRQKNQYPSQQHYQDEQINPTEKPIQETNQQDQSIEQLRHFIELSQSAPNYQDSQPNDFSQNQQHNFNQRKKNFNQFPTQRKDFQGQKEFQNQPIESELRNFNQALIQSPQIDFNSQLYNQQNNTRNQQQPIPSDFQRQNQQIPQIDHSNIVTPMPFQQQPLYPMLANSSSLPNNRTQIPNEESMQIPPNFNMEQLANMQQLLNFSQMPPNLQMSNLLQQQPRNLNPQQMHQPFLAFQNNLSQQAPGQQIDYNDQFLPQQNFPPINFQIPQYMQEHLLKNPPEFNQSSQPIIPFEQKQFAQQPQVQQSQINPYGLNGQNYMPQHGFIPGQGQPDENALMQLQLTQQQYDSRNFQQNLQQGSNNVNRNKPKKSLNKNAMVFQNK